MRDAQLTSTNLLIGSALLGAESILDEFRERLIDRISALRERFGQPNAITDSVRVMLTELEPLLAEHLSDTDLAAWIAGMDQLSQQFPPWLVREFQTGVRSYRSQPPIPPNRIKLFDMFRDEPRLRFPLIENAAKRLQERNILTRSQWDAASQAARKRAFTITGDLTADAINRVRNLLVDDVQQGTSLSGFRRRLEESIDTSSLGPGRIENIYRTNVQASFRDGRETLASDPIVSELFPYQEYLPIHDGRVRHEHLMLGQLGLNGTGIYRRDDPFWDHFTPPNGFNCRCGVRLLTVDAAARAGVQEAKQWLASGQRPATPEYRFSAIPFPPTPGFGSRGRTGVLV